MKRSPRHMSAVILNVPDGKVAVIEWWEDGEKKRVGVEGELRVRYRDAMPDTVVHGFNEDREEVDEDDREPEGVVRFWQSGKLVGEIRYDDSQDDRGEEEE